MEIVSIIILYYIIIVLGIDISSNAGFRLVLLVS